MIASEVEVEAMLFRDLPKSWSRRPLKFSGVFSGGGTPNTGNTNYWNGDIPWVSPKDMKTEVISTAIDRVTDMAIQETATSLILPPVVLIVVRSGILRRTIPIAISSVPVALNQDMKAIKVEDFLCERFLVRIIQGLEDYLLPLWRKQGATVESLEMERIGPTKIPIPPLHQQEQISDYIDRETSQIDALIAEKERMLALLEEKRVALISRAVTRGLNPDAPLKPSGLDWLGDIPEHWKIERAKNLFSVRDERSEDGQEELLTVSHITGVTPRSEKDVYMFKADDMTGYKKSMKGDFITNTLWAWMGAMGISPLDGIVSPDYHVYTSKGQILPDFMELLCRSRPFVAEINRWSKGVWSSRLRLYPENFFEIRFPVPPEIEQGVIVAAIDEDRRKAEKLSSALIDSITLLKERRSALITAAVTGQIDPEEMSV